jgi:hypothetical protein
MITKISFKYAVDHFSDLIVEVCKNYLIYYQVGGHDVYDEFSYTKREFETYGFEDDRFPKKLVNNIFKAFSYLEKEK